MMHFLQSHLAMLHYTSPVSTHSFDIQMVPSPSVTTSSEWQSHVPMNIATGLHLHHETISHPARNVWSCNGMPSHCRSPSLLQSSNPVSPCLHHCCSDREGVTAHRLHSQCGTFQTSTTNPSSPYMTRSHSQGGPSLLGLSAAFSSFPVICQAPQVASNSSIPTICNPHPLYSPVNSVYSNLALSVNTNLDPTHNQTQSQTPIHSSITPTGEPQYHTAFSPLSPSGVHTSMCTGHMLSQMVSMNGPRQNTLVGSSPMHYSQDLACSLLGQMTDRDCRASPSPERTDSIEAQGTCGSAPGVEIQQPLLDIAGIQS